MYRLTRKATAGTARIMIDAPPADSKDAGLALGGSFYFEPGVPQFLNEYPASVIMGDPGMAKDFECDPPFGQGGQQATAVEAPAAEAASTSAEEPARARGGRRAPSDN